MKTVFRYTIPVKVELSTRLLRKTLRDVRDALLAHEINGGGKKLEMSSICEANKCGTAACIGGWSSLFILGFEGKTEHEQEVVGSLFEALFNVSGKHDSLLYALFYDYDGTQDHNHPNVAATAINRYLNGKYPWPAGKMPRVLDYTKPAKR